MSSERLQQERPQASDRSSGPSRLARRRLQRQAAANDNTPSLRFRLLQLGLLLTVIGMIIGSVLLLAR